MSSYSVARIVQHTRSTITQSERHIERKNSNYSNLNVDTSRSGQNIHYCGCDGKTYNEHLSAMLDAGMVTTRGLKPDAKIFDEVIFDVNSEYFELNGGYEFASRFYADAFEFAKQLYGEQNIISAVMHADEINVALSERYGHPVYHYHLHVTALPVVTKEVRFSKRCKDPNLVGTIKSVEQQISHSKKWQSQPALDENGNIMHSKNGKTILVPSYSILQDNFYQYMRDAGYVGFERGRNNSTTEHLSCIQYNIEKEKQRLATLAQAIEKRESDLSSAMLAENDIDDIRSIGKPTVTGRVSVSRSEYDKLTALAGETSADRRKIRQLTGRLNDLERENDSLRLHVCSLSRQLSELTERCQPYLDAVAAMPTKVKAFFAEVALSVKKQRKAVGHSIMYRDFEEYKADLFDNADTR